LAGGIVTAQGGPLSHAAVLARELDLPAIVGATGALALVNGATITIDPRTGEVTVHSERRNQHDAHSSAGAGV